MKVLLVALALLSTGCLRFTTAYKLTDLQNRYDFYEGRYEDRCVNVTPPAPADCKSQQAALKKWKTDLDRAVWIRDPKDATKRIPRPNPITLQFKAAKDDGAVVEKAMKE